MSYGFTFAYSGAMPIRRHCMRRDNPLKGGKMRGPLPMIFNPLDPWGSLRDLLVDAYEYMVEFFQSAIVSPVRVSDAGILPIVYSSTLNLAVYFGYLIVVFALVVSVLTFRKGVRLTKAIGIWVLVGTAGAAIWIPTVNLMTEFGDDLSAVAAGIYTPPDTVSGGAPWLPTDIGWSILGLGNSLLGGLLLTVLLQNYEFLIILFKAIGPVAIVVGAIGPRAQKFANLILAAGLVATAVGRPFAVFFMEMGEVAVHTFPGGSSALGAMWYTVGSYYLAFLSQITLMFALYKGIAAVEGFVSSRVRGGIEAVIKKTVKVDAQKYRKEHAKPKAQPVYMKKAPPAKRAAKGAASLAAQGALMWAAGAMTGGSSVAVQRAGKVLGGALSLKGKKVPEPKKKSPVGTRA